MRLKLTVLLLCAAPLLRSQAIQVPPVGAPAATDSAQPSATIHQTVKNVLVDVVVTDKSGQPIKNLGKEHFQVLENGVPQPIAFFEEHEAGPPPAPFAHPLQLPPNVYTNIATSAPNSSPTLVLLMDALNTPATDQVKVRLAMLNYLRSIPPGCNIAIFTLTSKLRMLQGFNGDPATLIAALDQTAAWPKQSHLTDEVGKDSYADTAGDSGLTKNVLLAKDVLSSFVANEQAWRVDQRVGYTLAALNALATYLSALPGRKNLIWFSSSFPLGIGPDARMPQGFDPSQFTSENLGRSRDYEAELHSTSELLKLARVAVYPMDPSALATPAMFSSTQNNNESIHNGGAAIAQISQDSSDEMSVHATMDTIAESTGGRAFHNTNDLAGAINTVTQLGANYYTIAYVPKDTSYDGKYRKLIVKVDAPKARLDYRRGYYAEDPEKTGVSSLVHSGRTAALLLRGAPSATDVLFKVRVAPTEAAATATQPGSVRYSVNWSVDLRGLNLAGSAGGMRHGTLALAVVAYNSEAKAINTTSLPASLILQPDEYRLYLKSGLQFHQELDLPTGPVFLRVAIVNTENDRAGSVEIPLIVKAAQAQASSTMPAH